MTTHEPGTHLYTLWRKQRRLRVKLVIVVLVIVGLGLWLKPHLFPSSAHSAGGSSSGSQTAAKLTKGTPTFRTFVPEGKSIDSYGGWTRVSPSSSAAVYAYSDTLSGTALIVSQQELPTNFKSDTAAKIKQLQSDQGYATQHTILVDGMSVYIGVSEKSYQSTIFSRDGILVLITSYRTINDTAIGNYIKALN